MKNKRILAWMLGAGVAFAACGNENALRERIAGLEADNRALREELRATREAAANQARELADLRLAVAGILDAGEIATPERREARLTLLLNEIASHGTAQALKTISLIRTLREKYRAMPENSAERAEMLLQLDALEKDTNSLAFLLRPADTHDPSETRILAVDREISLAVLAAGSAHGVFPGMIYQVADSPIRLRVISVRGFVSAATPENGEISALNPGMRCFIRENRAPGQPFLPRN